MYEQDNCEYEQDDDGLPFQADCRVRVVNFLPEMQGGVHKSGVETTKMATSEQIR